MASMFQFRVSNLIGTDEYTPFLNDIVRVAIIQLVYQIMVMISKPDEYNLYYEEYFEALLYIVVGVAGYWLVFRKFVQIQ